VTRAGRLAFHRGVSIWISRTACIRARKSRVSRTRYGNKNGTRVLWLALRLERPYWTPWILIDLRSPLWDLASSSNLRYRVDHIQSHLHAAVSVIGPRLWKSGNAIVTVSEKLYPEAVMLGGQPVESAEYLGINFRFGITIYSRVTERREDSIRGEGSSERNV